MLSCEEVKKLLSAYYDGELGVAAQQQVAEHLAACESCREELEQFKAVSGAFHTLDFPVADKAFTMRLHERFEEEGKKNKPHWFGAMMKDMRTYATVAACLVLTVGIYAAVNNHSLKPVPVPPPVLSDSGKTGVQPTEAPEASTPRQPSSQGETGKRNFDNNAADNRAGEPEQPTQPVQTPAASSGERPGRDTGNGQEALNIAPQNTQTPDVSGYSVPDETTHPQATNVPRIENPGPSGNEQPSSLEPNGTEPSGSGHTGGTSGNASGVTIVNPTSAASSTSFTLTDLEKRDYVLEVLGRFGSVTVTDTEAQAKVLSSNYEACLTALRSVDGLQEVGSFTAEGDSDGYCYVRVQLQ